MNKSQYLYNKYFLTIFSIQNMKYGAFLQAHFAWIVNYKILMSQLSVKPAHIPTERPSVIGYSWMLTCITLTPVIIQAIQLGNTDADN